MKKRIMVDMDEVITTGGFLYLINKYTNANYTEEDFKTYYMEDILDDKKEFFKWFQNYNVYDYSTLYDNVYEVLEKLNNEYELFIGTSYILKEIINDTAFLIPQKYEYLLKNFTFLNPYNIIFLGNKSVLDVDIKIDDRIDNLSGAKTKLLFTAYHNKDISDNELKKLGIIRVNNWLDIEKILLKEGITNE